MATDPSERAIQQAKAFLKNADQDWDYLSGEERHGTIIQALEELDKVTDDD